MTFDVFTSFLNFAKCRNSYQCGKVDDKYDEFAAIPTTLLHFDDSLLIIHDKIKNSLCSLVIGNPVDSFDFGTLSMRFS